MQKKKKKTINPFFVLLSQPLAVAGWCSSVWRSYFWTLSSELFTGFLE